MAKKNGVPGLDVSAATVQPFGERTNKLLSISDLAKTLESRNKARFDTIVRRNDLKAKSIGTKEGDRFGFTFSGHDGTFRPTNVALTHLSNLTRIPLDHLRLTAAKYPDLAADMVNRWMHDSDIANRIGTAKPRVNRVDPGTQRQLVRAFEPNGSDGVLRAILSKGYRIIDNLDVAGIALDQIEKAKRDDVKIDGSLSEERMHLNFTLSDMRAEISFPEKGHGHKMIRVPCGAGLRVKNSDVGLAQMVVVPTLLVFSCTNLLVSTEELSQIHVGSEYKDMDILSHDTIRKMNASLFARMRDVIKACLVAEKFQAIADLFAENAGWPVDHPEQAILNISDKFSFGDEISKGILSKYIEETQDHGRTRFAMAQAITFQAHELKDKDYEKAVVLEEAGSQVLRMPQVMFAKQIDVEVV